MVFQFVQHQMIFLVTIVNLLAGKTPILTQVPIIALRASMLQDSIKAGRVLYVLLKMLLILLVKE